MDTPFSWNQVRGCVVEDDYLNCDHQLNPWECVLGNGTKVVDGDCPEGGNGFGCSCADERRNDPRQLLKVLY